MTRAIAGNGDGFERRHSDTSVPRPPNIGPSMVRSHLLAAARIPDRDCETVGANKGNRILVLIFLTHITHSSISTKMESHKSKNQLQSQAAEEPFSRQM